jgi:radical SAM superfamily enzyme
MKRIDLYRAQLKAAIAEEKIRAQKFNAAYKAFTNTSNRVTELEEKIATILAKAE